MECNFGFYYIPFYYITEFKLYNRFDFVIDTQWADFYYRKETLKTCSTVIC